jgi:hypothetical protein
MGDAVARLNITVLTRAALFISVQCAPVACPSVKITSPHDPATRPPFFFPFFFQGFRVFVTFEGSNTEVEYTSDPRWHLIATSGTALVSVQGRGVNATGAGSGPAGVSAVLAGGFGLTSLPVMINVLQSAALSAEATCPQSKLTPAGDPAGAAPLSIPSSADLSISVFLADGRSVALPFDERTRYEILTGGQFVSMKNNHIMVTGMNLTDSGRVEVRGTFPGVFNFSTPIVRLQVVRLRGLGVQLIYFGGGVGDGHTLRQLHCSGVFEGGDVRVSAELTDGSVQDVTQHTQMEATTGRGVLATKNGMIYGIGPGTASLTCTFASVTVQRAMSVVNNSTRITGVSILGFPTTLVGVANATTAMEVATRFENGAVLVFTTGGDAGVPWTDPEGLRGALLTFGGDDTGQSLNINSRSGRATLVGNSYRPILITVGTTACEGVSSHTSTEASVNLLPSADGDVDIGDATGLAVRPTMTGASVEIPIFLRSDGLLKAFEISLLESTGRLSVAGCLVGKDWSGAFSCTVNDPIGSVFIVGADVTSTRTGARVHVASVTLSAHHAGTAEIEGTRIKVASSLSDNLCPRCAIVAGRTPVLISNARRAMDAHAEDPPPLPRGSLKLQARRATGHGDVQGDANGDGVFDSSDYLFAQEFSLSPTGLIGCPLFGGVRCTPTANLSHWQLKQMDPVSDPLLSATAPRGNDLGFLLSVYSGKQRFCVEWASHSDSVSGLSIRVRLLDRDGLPARQQCKVLFILKTAMNTQAEFRTGSNKTAEGILIPAEYLDDGWYGIQSTGALHTEERVPFVFMIETMDGAGVTDDPMRRFPFYATRLPPYDLYFPKFQEFSDVRINDFVPAVTTESATTPLDDGPGTTTPITNVIPESTTPIPDAIPESTPLPAVTPVSVAVGVGGGVSLIALVALAAVGKRYWQAAVPAALVAKAPEPYSAPIIRIRMHPHATRIR